MQQIAFVTGTLCMPAMIYLEPFGSATLPTPDIFCGLPESASRKSLIKYVNTQNSTDTQRSGVSGGAYWYEVPATASVNNYTGFSGAGALPPSSGQGKGKDDA